MTLKVALVLDYTVTDLTLKLSHSDGMLAKVRHYVNIESYIRNFWIKFGDNLKPSFFLKQQLNMQLFPPQTSDPFLEHPKKQILSLGQRICFLSHSIIST